MNTRLQQFITAENISQSQLADNIGVARAAVSHVLAGRNKPSYDFIDGLIKHYPALNLDWLILGSGPMYKKGAEGSDSRMKQPASGDIVEVDLFSSPLPEPSYESPADSASSPVRESPADPVRPHYNQPQPQALQGSGQRRISKIQVFYSDGTFKEIL